MGLKSTFDGEKVFEIAARRTDHNIESWKDFEQIETQDKQSLLNDSKDDLLFEPKSKVLGGQTTSGTSGRMAAVMKTAADYEKEKSHNDKRLSEFFSQDSRVLILISSAWGYGILRDLRKRSIFGKIGNPYDLDYSAEIIENMNINCLFSNPSFALQIGRRLDGKDRENFKSLALGGSSLSTSARKELEDMFPRATIFKTYGTTESGSVAFQNNDISGTNKYIIDTDHHYVEILDEDGKPVKIGSEGEITITNVWKDSGIPLLRYRTGDKGVLIKENNSIFLKVLGRMTFDSIKVGGLSVYRENFETALEKVKELLKPEYQIIVEEKSEEEKAKPYLRIKAAPRTGFTKDELVRARTSEIIMENFKISDDKSWKDLADKGVFGEIKLDLVNEDYFEGKNAKVLDRRN